MRTARLERPKRETISDENEYDTDLSIDLNYLHLECQKHPELAMKYSKLFAKAKRKASILEEKVKTLRSQLVKQANENPDMYLGKGVKATAPNVEAYYRDNTEYKEVKQNWIDAVYEMDLLEGAKFAFAARKSMLEEEVRLHGQQYYSTPEINDLSEASKQFNEIKERLVENRIRERMRS
jgi:hypothetical protein